MMSPGLSSHTVIALSFPSWRPPTHNPSSFPTPASLSLQCYAERLASDAVAPELLECAVNPAVFEIAGHIVLKRAEDYAAVSEEWADRLLAAASLDDVTFQKVRDKYSFKGVTYFPRWRGRAGLYRGAAFQKVER